MNKKLVYTLQASVCEDSIVKSYGKPYVFRYWSLNKNIMLVSDYPFKRGDLVEFEETNNEAVFLLNKVDESKISQEEKRTSGLLLPLSTDVPLSRDVNYTFEVIGGDVEILKVIKCDNAESVSYIVLVSNRSDKSKIRGKDSTYGDEFEWFIDNTRDTGVIHREDQKIKSSS